MMGFAASALISLLERELLQHEPEIQQFIISELSTLLESLMSHLNTKLQLATGDANGRQE